jgi:hypothetical protein
MRLALSLALVLAALPAFAIDPPPFYSENFNTDIPITLLPRPDIPPPPPPEIPVPPKNPEPGSGFSYPA